MIDSATCTLVETIASSDDAWFSLLGFLLAFFFPPFFFCFSLEAIVTEWLVIDSATCTLVETIASMAAQFPAIM